eukprot:6209512-Pleurochrysis_carterae.AAC.1
MNSLKWLRAPLGTPVCVGDKSAGQREDECTRARCWHESDRRRCVAVREDDARPAVHSYSSSMREMASV